MVVTSKLGLVARRLESDIRARGLRSGDRYLTVAEAAEVLGVSPATAHRAMDLLVDRKLLTRHHGRGTFVGEAVQAPPRARVRTVYIMLSEDQEGVTSVQLDDMVSAVRSKLPGVNVQFCFIPSVTGLDYVKELIQSSQQIGQLAGVIAISCSREIYRHLEQEGVATVVLGSLYGDQRHLPSVDINYRRVGKLLAEYLVGKGHKKMVMFTTSDGRPGDHAFVDGVSDALTGAKLPHNALTIRIFPRDFEAFRLQVRELLEQDIRPTGVICGSERLVGAVAAVAAELKIAVPKQLEIVFNGQATPAVDGMPYVHTRPQMPFKQIAELVVNMLRLLTEKQKISDDRVIIDAELRVPSEHAGKSRNSG